jgi:hypothetical protein
MTRARNLADFNTAGVLTSTSTINPANLDSTGTIPSALLADVGGGENTPYFLAYRSGNQTGLINNGWREVICNSQTTDSDSAYNSTTGRFTPQEAGYYYVQFVGSARDFTTAGALPVQQIMYGIKKNATGDPISVNYIDLSETHVQRFTSTVSTIVYLNGHTSFVSPYVYVVGGNNQTYAIHGESQYTNFSAFKISE